MADTLTTADGGWCHIHEKWHLENVPKVRSYNWDLAFDPAEHYCPVRKAERRAEAQARRMAEREKNALAPATTT